MKNRNLIIALGVGLVIVVVGGFLVLRSDKSEAPEPQQTTVEEQIVTLKPEDIGLTLTATSDNRKVIMEVESTTGISALDYELSYISKGDIPRGVIGHVDVQEGKKVTQQITLGTCSDVCHYDEDVSDVKLILKVTKTDGSTAQVESSLEL